MFSRQRKRARKPKSAERAPSGSNTSIRSCSKNLVLLVSAHGARTTASTTTRPPVPRSCCRPPQAPRPAGARPAPSSSSRTATRNGSSSSSSNKLASFEYINNNNNNNNNKSEECSGTSTPNSRKAKMMDSSELRMNVAALKRVDPYVRDILETATHVALYLFISEANEWEKAEIEGALFIYSRIGEPYNSFLIMNRLSTNNQVEPVTAALEVQCQEPFLLYRNSKGVIYGIWFYDKNECVKVANTLTELAKNSGSPNKSPPKSKKQIAQKKPSNVDIFSMLSKAQEDYNSNKSSTADKGARPVETKSPMSSAIGELTGPLSAMAMAPDVTSKSVMDFFAKAKVSNTSHYKTSDHQAPPCNVNEDKPLLQRLMSHPAAHTVEHIEKQQRSITPQPAAPQPGMIPANSQSCENSILAKLQKCKVPVKNASGHSYGQEYRGLNTSTCSVVIRSEISSITNEDESNTSGFLRIQSPTANSNSMINQHKNATNYTNAFDKLFRAGSPIAASDNMYQHNSTACDDLIPPLTPKSTIGNESAPALIPPGMFAAPSPAAETLNRPVEPLTRNQLLQAFNYLLRTDPEFVNKLHEAYVKSFSEILS